MEPRYKVGQRIIAKPVQDESLSTRDAGIEQYAGQSGIVTNYHWIRPHAGKVFFIYTVQIGDGQKEIVLHEDEMEAD